MKSYLVSSRDLKQKWGMKEENKTRTFCFGDHLSKVANQPGDHYHNLNDDGEDNIG